MFFLYASTPGWLNGDFRANRGEDFKTSKTSKTFSTKNLQKCKFYCTFAPVISPRLGIVSL